MIAAASALCVYELRLRGPRAPSVLVSEWLRSAARFPPEARGSCVSPSLDWGILLRPYSLSGGRSFFCCDPLCSCAMRAAQCRALLLTNHRCNLWTLRTPGC